MQIDTTFDFSTNQAITTASVRSTREKDLGAVMRDIGNGTPLFMVYLVTETFVVATSAPALVFNNVLDVLPAQSGLTTATLVGSSVQFFGSHPVSTANELTIGQRITIPISPLSEAQRAYSQALTLPWRYLGAFYTLSGGTFSAGRVSCFLTDRAPTSPIKLTKFSDGIASNR